MFLTMCKREGLPYYIIVNFSWLVSGFAFYSIIENGCKDSN
jgi:hypothetical protein